MSDNVQPQTWLDLSKFPFKALFGATSHFMLWAVLLFALVLPHIPHPPAPADAVISLSPQVKGQAGVLVNLEAVTKDTKAEVRWWCQGGQIQPLKDSHQAVFVAPKPGVYTILAYTADKDGATPPVTCQAYIDVSPPGPGPTPTPTPTPGPGPAPIPGDGLRVLVVYKADDLAKYKPAQLDAMYGKQIQDYLSSHCVKGPDGKTPEFRFFPDNADTKNESSTWQTALQKAISDAKGQYPWVLVANGDKGASQAYPGDPASALKLLQSIGGQ